MSRGSRKTSRAASIALPALFALCVAAPVMAATDWENLAATSDPVLDQTLLSMMKSSDMDTRLAICRGLGKRNSPSIGVFLEGLCAGYTGTSSVSTELCFRILLESVFDPALGEQVLESRLSFNAAALEMMFQRIDEWKDPQFVGVLVRLASLMKSQQSVAAVMAVGSRIVAEMQRSGGRLTPMQSSLANDLLAAITRLDRGEFLWECAEIARLSRDASLVEKARSAAARISAPATHL